MAVPLLPLIGLAAQFVPGLVGAIAGDKAGQVADQVGKVATTLFGTADAGAVETAIARDPALALQFKLETARIVDQAEQRRHDERMEELRTASANITAEASSADRYTSRARPSFMYVMYVMILWSIPMGILFAIFPQVADDVIEGMRRYLGGIPEAMWMLFGACFTGYTVSRGWEKVKGASK